MDNYQQELKQALMTLSVVQVPVLRNGESLFDLLPSCTFKVPLYQRAFAWGTPPHEVNENELICLMDDIYDAAGPGKNDFDRYYIGSAVVKAVDTNGCLECEVIDGQQRLTALFILLNCLDVEIKAKNPLDYAQRSRSKRSVERIKEIVKYAKAFVNKEIQEGSVIFRAEQGQSIKSASGDYQAKAGDWIYGNELLENSICNGAVAILQHLRIREKGYAQALKDGLARVRLYVVRVPDNTDLNRYFEVMNTRGEQLDPQDIVKAMIMRQITDVKKRDRFAQIWNACSDMNGYVQMHFTPKVRDEIFGKDWTALPKIDLRETGDAAEGTQWSLCDSLLQGDVRWESEEQSPDDGAEKKESDSDPVRFRSVIYFPHFLLNVLRVFNHQKGHGDLDGSELDVSKMIRSFEGLFKKDGEDLPDASKAEVAWKFAECLLTCRYLFDQYIVKRDYERDPIDGDWSIKQLRQSPDDKGQKRTAYYVSSDWQKDEDAEISSRREEILMLQSCLRVTYTEFKGMHWITILLDWLFREHKNGTVSFADYLNTIEKYACMETKKSVEDLRRANLRQGTATKHLIFNYLDFLLWKDAVAQKRFKSQGGNGTWDPFVFAYRNSVEHWYPQHPEGYQQNRQLIWEAPDNEGRRAVDQFGNLCVVQPSENSKFSNLKPSAKKLQYRNAVLGGSLKLRIMEERTPEDEVRWKEVCAQHGEEMLEILDTAFKRVLGDQNQNRLR